MNIFKSTEDLVQDSTVIPFTQFTLDHVARTVGYIFEGEAIHLMTFPQLLEKYRTRLNYRLQKHFKEADRYSPEKVLRKIHANAIKEAIEGKEIIPVENLQFHQFTPALFNDVKMYARSRRINLDY